MRRSLVLGVVAMSLIMAGGASAASSWTVVTMPNPGPQGTDMHGVAAVPQTSDAWAVGEAFTRSSRFLAVDSWDGATWSASPTHAGVSRPSALNGVAAQDASDAWAVGWSRTTMEQTLALQWNGSTWSQMAPLNVSNSVLDEFNGVAALGNGAIMAVGEYSDSADVDHALAEKYDPATGWTVYTPLPADLSSLAAVAAVPNSGTAWAVGVDGDKAVILSWDGATWTRVTDASSTAVSSLNGIVARAANDVWAVGAQGPTRDQTTPLIEHWDGASWSVVPAPSPSSANYPVVTLRSIAALPGRDTLWAVGEKDNSNFRASTVTERWDGAAWTIVRSPDPNRNNLLEGVAATHGGTLAVGFQYGNPRSSLGLMHP